MTAATDGSGSDSTLRRGDGDADAKGSVVEMTAAPVDRYALAGKEAGGPAVLRDDDDDADHDVGSADVELTPMEAFKVSVDGDQSPFPEVASTVPNTDEPTMACNTFRAWALLTIFVVAFSGANQFFGLRYPSLSIGYVVAQLLVFPIGRAWERLPRWRVPLGPLTFDFNPGRFTVKEHALVVIAVSISANTAYASGSLVSIISPEYWGRDYGVAFSFLYLLTTQMLGFGLAGLARRWLVYPAALIWPSTLSSTVLFRALHEPQDRTAVNGWRLSRYRFFTYFTILAFVVFCFPDYIWTSLSTFAFVTWIWPHNQKINTIFGMNSGLGLLPISFDWTQINYAGAPLITPFYVTANAFAVVVIFYLIMSPILYYSNVWQSAYLPLLSSTTFDNTGHKYNISAVVDKQLNLVLGKYQQYSPMYVSMSYSLSYGLSFAAVTSMLVHTALYNGPEIWAKVRDARHGGEDVHRRLMRRNYKEVPEWWYVLLTVTVLAFGCVVVHCWETGLPIWGFIVICFGTGVLLIVPEGILEGTTNQRVFLNIITEMIAGYVFPGKAVANMMVKCYGYNSVKHGMDFAQDLKLGQYMKIPPRVMFTSQVYASVLATATQTGVLRWMMAHIPKLCSPTNTQRFTCQNAKVTYNASLIWGTIGPQRMFAAGETYHILLYFFLVGPLVTVLVWLLYRRYPQSWLRYINCPIFWNAAGNIPPANTAQYSLWFIFGLLFNHVIRRRAFGWWKRYNYLLQAALDSGTALATIVIFFALSYHDIELRWWGNTVGHDTDDANGKPWLSVPAGKHFGRGPGQF